MSSPPLSLSAGLAAIALVGLACKVDPPGGSPAPSHSAASPPHPVALVAAGLPPLVDACKTDSDCGYTFTAINGPNTCCQTPILSVGTHAWVSSLASTCAARAPDCSKLPPQKPLLQEPKLTCASGRCVLP